MDGGRAGKEDVRDLQGKYCELICLGTNVFCHKPSIIGADLNATNIPSKCTDNGASVNLRNGRSSAVEGCFLSKIIRS